ncbi:MAG: 23S rRNA (uracil(1939)-C(5))-methyltransferase RlmD [Candidatus Gastranaerophilales bacterium]|nr:23S rRNA (uracil(1939)-C(5))-methyltransferase RlmD [Candidatus Gastranaerophilales bacterium]
MKVLDEIIVNIEKLSNLGFGLAKHEGMVVFVENACPGDKLKVKITKLHKNWANAQIIEILEKSPHRIEPPCAMQNICGGCQLQFIDYDYQLRLKKEIIEDALKSIGGLDIEVKNPVPSPENLHYRHKVQYPITQTKVSQRILAGYYKPKSHEIVNIKYCPIQPLICDEIIEFIRNSAFDYAISGYNEGKHTGDLRHVVIRVSKATGKILVTLVVNSTKIFERLKDFAQNIYDNFKEVTGVCVNFNSKKTNVIMGENTELIVGKNFVKEQILDKTFRIGSKTFFQINPQSAENIFSFVRDYIKGLNEAGQRESSLGLPTQQQKTGNKTSALPVVLDAYAGVTSFGITVSDICKKVVCVEENADSVKLAEETIKLNGIKNIELHKMDTQKFLETKLNECLTFHPSPLGGEGVFRCEERASEKLGEGLFDIIILDPPRKGCSEESLQYAMQLCKGKIIYVSCNPATLARDLKYLVSKGAKVELIQPFDMFCHTYHIESVAIINII